MKYINPGETAYRKMQTTLKEAMEGGQDEFSGDEWEIAGQNKCQRPKRLRG